MFPVHGTHRLLAQTQVEGVRVDSLCPWVEDSGYVATSELGEQTQLDRIAPSLQIPVSVPHALPYHVTLPARSHVLTHCHGPLVLQPTLVTMGPLGGRTWDFSCKHFLALARALRRKSGSQVTGKP